MPVVSNTRNGKGKLTPTLSTRPNSPQLRTTVIQAAKVRGRWHNSARSKGRWGGNGLGRRVRKGNWFLSLSLSHYLYLSFSLSLFFSLSHVTSTCKG